MNAEIKVAGLIHIADVSYGVPNAEGQAGGAYQDCARCGESLQHYDENTFVASPAGWKPAWWPVGAEIVITTGNPRYSGPPDGYRLAPGFAFESCVDERRPS